MRPLLKVPTNLKAVDDDIVDADFEDLDDDNKRA